MSETITECQRIEALIDARVEGSMKELEYVQLTEHLKACAKCAEKFYLALRTEDALKLALIPDGRALKSSSKSKADLKKLI